MLGNNSRISSSKSFPSFSTENSIATMTSFTKSGCLLSIIDAKSSFPPATKISMRIAAETAIVIMIKYSIEITQSSFVGLPVAMIL